LEIVAGVRARYDLPVATHLTCVGSTVEELCGYLREAQDRGIDNVVALRGDPPQGEDRFTAIDGGLSYASELVELVRREFPNMGIAVAGYPETHLEAVSPQADLENLRRKVDAGGDVVLTQVYYDNADFFRFRDQCQSLGITVPIVPGILPVTNFAQIQRITSLCGAKLPEKFSDELQSCGEDTDAQFEVGVRYAAEQVQELVDAGVPGVHFYVLNKSQATSRVLRSVTVPR
jgi:methylenetetrahydrofolate reductase (NADPH)